MNRIGSDCARKLGEAGNFTWWDGTEAHVWLQSEEADVVTTKEGLPQECFEVGFSVGVYTQPKTWTTHQGYQIAISPQEGKVVVRKVSEGDFLGGTYPSLDKFVHIPAPYNVRVAEGDDPNQQTYHFSVSAEIVALECAQGLASEGHIAMVARPRKGGVVLIVELNAELEERSQVEYPEFCKQYPGIMGDILFRARGRRVIDWMYRTEERACQFVYDREESTVNISGSTGCSLDDSMILPEDCQVTPVDSGQYQISCPE
jgi:hypothetical protein